MYQCALTQTIFKRNPYAVLISVSIIILSLIYAVLLNFQNPIPCQSTISMIRPIYKSLSEETSTSMQEAEEEGEERKEEEGKKEEEGEGEEEEQAPGGVNQSTQDIEAESKQTDQPHRKNQQTQKNLSCNIQTLNDDKLSSNVECKGPKLCKEKGIGCGKSIKNTETNEGKSFTEVNESRVKDCSVMFLVESEKRVARKGATLSECLNDEVTKRSSKENVRCFDCGVPVGRSKDEAAKACSMQSGKELNTVTDVVCCVDAIHGKTPEKSNFNQDKNERKLAGKGRGEVCVEVLSYDNIAFNMEETEVFNDQSVRSAAVSHPMYLGNDSGGGLIDHTCLAGNAVHEGITMRLGSEGASQESRNVKALDSHDEMIIINEVINKGMEILRAESDAGTNNK